MRLLMLLWAAPLLAQSVLIQGVPHLRQKPDFCGEACVAMALGHGGRAVSQDAVFAASGLPANAGRGCFTPDLYRALQALGVQTPAPWVALPDEAGARAGALSSEWARLRRVLSVGGLPIVCMRFDDPPRDSEHFRLLVGFDERQGTVTYHDPALDGGAYQTMAVAKFPRLWPLSDGRGHRFLVRFVVPSGDPELAATQRRLGPGFRVAREGPFLVAGDGTAAEFAAARSGTIRWAYQHLRREFFDQRGLDRTITVYLFRDKDSYQHNARALFGETPDTPFGYYSARFNALVMNISTGGGTLVHEMVHPLLATDFPGVPAWFNEGLASLFEQCGESQDRIVGFLNWRLPGLQRAIANGTLGSLSKLMSTTSGQFYGPDAGANYAQARYLLYWLQEQGLLHEYYRRFRANHAKDPTGIQTLRTVLGGRSIEEIDRAFTEFARGLSV